MSNWLQSCLCTQELLGSETFCAWSQRLQPALPRYGLCHPDGTGYTHRKLWEWCYIAQALHERGMLGPGRRGLAFAVGQEPLPALFAGLGCEIVATDLAEESAKEAGWVDSHQHAADRAVLNQDGLCDPEAFQKLVSFRSVDMNQIPADLHRAPLFDFVWSSCSMEHLGSIRNGQRFVANAMRCLKPGGVAVHTTEFNVWSDTATVDNAATVLFRRQDVGRIAAGAEARGDRIELDLTPGGSAADYCIDVPPYHSEPHLKLLVGGYVTTSLGLILVKARSSPIPSRRRGAVGGAFSILLLMAAAARRRASK